MNSPHKITLFKVSCPLIVCVVVWNNVEHNGAKAGVHIANDGGSSPEPGSFSDRKQKNVLRFSARKQEHSPSISI